MDHEQFAALTRLVAARGPSRRTILALLGTALFGRAGMLVDGGNEAEAKKSGGRDGGKHHGRNRGNGRHRSRRRKGHDQRQKQKDTTNCAGVGEEPRPETPCCPELLLDSDGRCAESPPPSCAETCDGCCDGETCVTEISNEACGADGSPCVTCSASQTCGRCQPGICGAAQPCIPRTTCVSAECGPQSDGCGGVLQCGPCPASQICGGGDMPSRCGGGGSGSCTARTCAQLGVQCGPVANGCGGLLNCGACPAGQVCIGDRCRSVC